MKSEKSTLQEEITSLRNQVSDRDKEVRKTKEELMEIQDDVTHLTDKLADVRQQKVKFARLDREKGEEIGKVWLLMGEMCWGFILTFLIWDTPYCVQFVVVFWFFYFYFFTASEFLSNIDVYFNVCCIKGSCVCVCVSLSVCRGNVW